jgi:hypothetical protein
VQRILSNGAEAFAHNGVVVSTVAARVRVSPSAAFAPASQEIFVFWKEQTSSQSQAGVFGQKIDAAGTRQWTDAGAQVVALSSDDIGSIETWAVGTGAMVFWDRAPAFNQDRLYGARLTGAGAVDLGPFDVSSTASGKSRLQVRESAGGFAVLAWQDARVDGADIYAQSVQSDGTLGADPASAPEMGSTVSRSLVYPNPSSGEVGIAFRGLGDADGTLSSGGLAPTGPNQGVPLVVRPTAEVFDVHGRSVRHGLELSSQGDLVWDGRDDSRRLAAPGVYYVRLSDRSEAVSVTIIR